MSILAEKLAGVPFWAMTPGELGARVKQLRARQKVSQYEVARRAGIQLAVYMRVEKGETNPTLATLSAVCKGLGVSLQELVGSAREIVQRAREPIIVFPRTQSERDKLAESESADSFIPVPLLADPASLGPGLSIEEANIEGYCLIYKSQLGKGKHFAIRLKGDSMKPTLGDGEIVAVDVNQTDPKRLRGKLVAAKVGDGVTIKRLVIRESSDRPWYFQADNSEWEREHGQITSKPKNGVILGKVEWSWRRFE